jgi:hypothetical protein
VGSDGLILVTPPTDPAAHVRMIMYNPDGSRAQMCGNGIRCLAKLAYERGLARGHQCLCAGTPARDEAGDLAVLEAGSGDHGRGAGLRVLFRGLFFRG